MVNIFKLRSVNVVCMSLYLTPGQMHQNDPYCSTLHKSLTCCHSNDWRFVPFMFFLVLVWPVWQEHSLTVFPLCVSALLSHSLLPSCVTLHTHYWVQTQHDVTYSNFSYFVSLNWLFFLSHFRNFSLQILVSCFLFQNPHRRPALQVRPPRMWKSFHPAV